MPASAQEIRSEWNPVNGRAVFFLTEFDPPFVFKYPFKGSMVPGSKVQLVLTLFNLLSEWLCDQAQVPRSGAECLRGLRRAARWQQTSLILLV